MKFIAQLLRLDHIRNNLSLNSISPMIILGLYWQLSVLYEGGLTAIWSQIVVSVALFANLA